MTPWLALLLLGSTASAQEKSSTGSLERARRTFAAADADKNQSLIFGELELAGLSLRSFKKFDADQSESWSEADFLLYYEHLLVSAGKKIDPAFEQELERIKVRRDPTRKPASTKEKVGARETERSTEGKAELAAPVARVKRTKTPVEPPAATPVGNRKPAPPITLNPETVPTPRDGAIGSDPEREAYEKAARIREEARTPAGVKAVKKPEAASEGDSKNLLERAKEAQKRKQELAKPKTRNKRTQG